MEPAYYKNFPKEGISHLKYPEIEVLPDPVERSNRRELLQRSLVLGNIDHHKVRICFVDTEGPKTVETTIWGLTEHRVILKGGCFIPIKRIVTVKLF